MKTAIIGRGNVATHIAKALSGKIEIVMVNPHTLEGLPPDSDIILISVSDDAIREVALKCRDLINQSPKTLIAHTSGSVGIQVLADCALETGVFYPLQTFSKNVALDYKEIPFFIEGSSENSFDRLCELARLISDNVFRADSEKRRRLHIAAVFACNFSNHLVNIADTLLHDQGMDYKVLLPLLKETVRKLETVTPAKAQTGPASRGDNNVISSHMAALSSKPEFQHLYGSLSQSIINTNLSKEK